jgi:hypothetical protein
MIYPTCVQLGCLWHMEYLLEAIATTVSSQHLSNISIQPIVTAEIGEFVVQLSLLRTSGASSRRWSDIRC